MKKNILRKKTTHEYFTSQKVEHGEATMLLDRRKPQHLFHHNDSRSDSSIVLLWRALSWSRANETGRQLAIKFDDNPDDETIETSMSARWCKKCFNLEVFDLDPTLVPLGVQQQHQGRKKLCL